jgi:hypothetical protein
MGCPHAYLLFTHFWFLPERLARQDETVISLHHKVPNCISNGGAPDPCMPVLNRQLAGDDGVRLGALGLNAHAKHERSDVTRPNVDALTVQLPDCACGGCTALIF